MSTTEVRDEPSHANGILPPNLDLPYPDSPSEITANLLKLTELAPNPRARIVFKSLISKLHEFISQTNITTEEWRSGIEFLVGLNEASAPRGRQLNLLSDVFGMTALVDRLNNPRIGNATESSLLGPFFTEDAPDLLFGESIASEGIGENMFVEGRVLTTGGEPIPGAVIDTWETDGTGLYDMQHAERTVPDYRGRLRTDGEGKYGYRAIVPVSYAIPGDGPVCRLLQSLGRHNVRPNHLHVVIHAPGFHKLVTALYPDGDPYLSSDVVHGVKKSLVVKLTEIDDEAEARKRGFQKGTKFKLLNYDFVLVTEDEWAGARRT
ncbi:aromatic compound dioxygenase [Russula ochroleuca]|uniref:Aromatic compound dioxygenase n=1 Tax=Russula ochroleuca TaxID=152965 RepID=A0A9P5N1X8_9AGAM|nr:aromatic compound dioxygenase [Russula ochroleuca]KAF8483868.1 aromatic compound dioxygenase [Russula ochroleuca]